MRTIFFDMDGTIADLYGVENWLESLINSDTHPYAVARPLVNLNSLARRLNSLARQGYGVAIVSWTSKHGTIEYNEEIAAVKKKWLAIHLKSVKWTEINIVPYGTNKSAFLKNEHDILFDDEARNREEWTENGGIAFDEKSILEILKKMGNE